MKQIATLVLAVGLVAAAGCSDDGDGDAAATTTTVAADPSSTAAPESPDDPADPGSGEADSGSGETDDPTTTEAAGAAPEEQALDVEVRHPNGVTLRLSRLAFEAGDIVIDAEVVNSSRSEIVFHFGNVTGERLRLVDDAGTEYNFVEPTDDEGVLKVAAGETLDGTLAFRGPLSGQPDQLRLVTNLYPRELDGFDIAQESDTTGYPGFLVPLDLVWR